MIKAAAIAYDQQKEHLPKVVAKGQGHIAKAIIEKAQEYEITLFENKELVDALLDYECNTFIEPELYESVAKVLAWLQNINASQK